MDFTGTFLDVVLWTIWFTLLFAAFWLLIAIVTDIFRDSTLSGWGKAAWTIFIIFLPWLGALVYLIARGRSMNERSMQEARRRESEMRDYVREVAGPTSTADELTKLAGLKSSGALTDAEYQQAKAALLSGGPAHATDGTVRQPV